MLSMPPASTMLDSPARMALAARETAFSDEPQTLLTVSAATESGRPALRAAWRAGFWPAPACTTWPMTTSSTRRASSPERARDSFSARAPSATAERSLNAPPNFPMGVRTLEARTTSSDEAMMADGRVPPKKVPPTASVKAHASRGHAAGREAWAFTLAVGGTFFGGTLPSAIMASSEDVVLASSVRTPIGKFGGAFKDLSAVALGALALKESLARSGLDARLVEEVVMGQVVQAGAGQNPARQAALKAGLPDSVAALTVNKVCGSSLKAVSLAANAIRAGESSIVLAGGMESMSGAPYLVP